MVTLKQSPVKPPMFRGPNVGRQKPELREASFKIHGLVFMGFYTGCTRVLKSFGFRASFV